MLFLFCSPWMRDSIALSSAVFVGFFLVFFYIFVPLHTGQSVATVSGAVYIQWANPLRPHCINTHLAAAVMKGFVSNWTFFLGEAPCRWLNAIYVFSVMKWMMEIDLLVKCADVAKLFPF